MRPRDEQLLGGAPAQLDGLAGLGARRRGEVGGRRLGAAAGVGGRLAELDGERAALGLARLAAELEHQAQQLDLAVEGERLAGPARRLQRVLGGARLLAGGAEVDGERLGVDLRVEQQGGGDAGVQGAAALRAPSTPSTASAMRVR